MLRKFGNLTLIKEDTMCYLCNKLILRTFGTGPVNKAYIMY